MNVNTVDFVNEQRASKSIRELSNRTRLSESACKQRIKTLIRKGWEKKLRTSYSYEWNQDNRGRKRIGDTMSCFDDYSEPVIADSELMQELAEVKAGASIDQTM